MAHVKQQTSKPQTRRLISEVIATLAVVGSYVAYGTLNARRIHVEHLVFESGKLREPLRLAFMSDIHFAEYNYYAVWDTVGKINDSNVDALILGGDLIDNTTPDPYIATLFELLGNVKTKYGVYFVWGNHDRLSGKSDTAHETIYKMLRDNNIQILSENSIPIRRDVVLHGREDFYNETGWPRKSLVQYIMHPTGFNVLVEHAPRDFKLAAKIGVDLMLCGHTHDGQYFLEKCHQTVHKCRPSGVHDINGMPVVMSPGAGVGKYSWRARTVNKCKCHIIDVFPTEGDS